MDPYADMRFVGEHWWRNKPAGRMVNVLAFGAFRDGVTDDTQAFRLAGEYARSIGGFVYVPAGTYRVTAL